MSTRRPCRVVAMILIVTGAGSLAGGCATTGDPYGTGAYDYGAYFGSSWYDPYPWHPYDPIYVGPPIDRPPSGDWPPDWRPPGTGGGERPAHLPARPMPPPRPATMGGGFRGGGGRGGGLR